MELSLICIYAIINIVNDKHYVGQAADKDYRWREHRKSLRGFYHHSLPLQRAWSKYGEQNFIFVVLEKLDEVDDLNEREAHWGKLLKPEYNVAPLGGSMRGYKHTEEARQNMSDAHKGYKASAETKARMSAQRIGNKFPRIPRIDNRIYPQPRRCVVWRSLFVVTSFDFFKELLLSFRIRLMSF